MVLGSPDGECRTIARDRTGGSNVLGVRPARRLAVLGLKPAGRRPGEERKTRSSALRRRREAVRRPPEPGMGEGGPKHRAAGGFAERKEAFAAEESRKQKVGAVTNSKLASRSELTSVVGL